MSLNIYFIIILFYFKHKLFQLSFWTTAHIFFFPQEKKKKKIFSSQLNCAAESFNSSVKASIIIQLLLLILDPLINLLLYTWRYREYNYHTHLT